MTTNSGFSLERTSDGKYVPCAWYNNLSQYPGYRNCYIRSTDIEQKNWHRLLWSFTDDMFYNIYKNGMIGITDKSTNEKGKVERIYIPVMEDVLNYLSRGEEPKNIKLKSHFIKALNDLKNDKDLQTRIYYWTDRIKSHVEIKAETIVVDREPNPLEAVDGKNVHDR